jgi:hypothetical protein
MIRTILQQYRDESAFNRDLGDRFERLIRAYLGSPQKTENKALQGLPHKSSST